MPFCPRPTAKRFAGERGALDNVRVLRQVRIRTACAAGVQANFVRRLHHHAASALEQGIFLIDKQGRIRHRAVVGPIDPVPDGLELAALTRVHCADGLPAT